ncbi:hypothetical protein EI94DRAFT_196073 [Lactarius quietus]|nr:hypothetical protein EI94DRAFT_196073 [Lactarius quietus]
MQCIARSNHFVRCAVRPLCAAHRPPSISPCHIHRLSPCIHARSTASRTTRLSASASSAIAQNDFWIPIFVSAIQGSAERCLLYPTYGAYLGEWFGMIPIGVDWDWPWQAHPLTLTVGAALGYMAERLEHSSGAGGSGMSNLQNTRRKDWSRNPS